MVILAPDTDIGINRRRQGTPPLNVTQGEDKIRSVYSMGFFTSDSVEVKYLDIEIIRWANFPKLTLISVTFGRFFRKSAKQNKIRKSLKCKFFGIPIFFFCLILYYPVFYSSLSDKKQRNGSISKMFPILVNLAKILPKMLTLSSITHFRIYTWQIFPI